MRICSAFPIMGGGPRARYVETSTEALQRTYRKYGLFETLDMATKNADLSTGVSH